RHEVAVHDVEVDPIHTGVRRTPDRVGEAAEVGVEDARRDLDAWNWTPGHDAVPAGTPSALRSPRSAAALSRSMRERRRATAWAGGSPARSAASWPQAAPMSWPRFLRTVVAMPACRSTAANRSIASGGLDS